MAYFKTSDGRIKQYDAEVNSDGSLRPARRVDVLEESDKDSTLDDYHHRLLQRELENKIIQEIRATKEEKKVFDFGLPSHILWSFYDEDSYRFDEIKNLNIPCFEQLEELMNGTRLVLKEYTEYMDFKRVTVYIPFLQSIYNNEEAYIPNDWDYIWSSTVDQYGLIKVLNIRNRRMLPANIAKEDSAYVLLVKHLIG